MLVSRRVFSSFHLCHGLKIAFGWDGGKFSAMNDLDVQVRCSIVAILASIAYKSGDYAIIRLRDTAVFVPNTAGICLDD